MSDKLVQEEYDRIVQAIKTLFLTGNLVAIPTTHLAALIQWLNLEMTRRETEEKAA